LQCGGCGLGLGLALVVAGLDLGLALGSWAVLKVLGLDLEFSGRGLGRGFMTCGLINIMDHTSLLGLRLYRMR